MTRFRTFEFEFLRMGGLIFLFFSFCLSFFFIAIAIAHPMDSTAWTIAAPIIVYPFLHFFGWWNRWRALAVVGALWHAGACVFFVWMAFNSEGHTFPERAATCGVGVFLLLLGVALLRYAFCEPGGVTGFALLPELSSPEPEPDVRIAGDQSFHIQLGITGMRWNRSDVWMKVLLVVAVPAMFAGFAMSVILFMGWPIIIIGSIKRISREMNLTLMLLWLSVISIFTAWVWWGTIQWLRARVLHVILLVGACAMSIGYATAILMILRYAG